MKITYDIYHFYPGDKPIGDPFKTVTVDTHEPIGREIRDAFYRAGRLHVGASYIGCVIKAIEDN